jgi:hypothetical protein
VRALNKAAFVAERGMLGPAGEAASGAIPLHSTLVI